MSSDEDNIPFGPAIPPNLLLPRSPSRDRSPLTNYVEKERVFGPVIPKNLTRHYPPSDNENSSLSPGTPDVHSDMIGPLPEGYEIMEELRHSRPDEEQPRSKHSKTKGLQREKWMTELPDNGVLPNLGLTARQFRSSNKSQSQREIVESRRAWTSVAGKVEETPQTEAEKRQMMMEEIAISENRKRDILLREMSERTQIQSHRDKTLLQIHEEKLAKKSKKKDKRKQKKSKKRLKSSRHKSKSKRSKKKKSHRKHSSSSSSSVSSSESSASSSSSSSDTDMEPIRVPFDREKDLRTNVITTAQRKGIIARSQNLHTRFGSGAQQFL